ncbi:MAG: DUF3793 family protein [Erysipelotrichaceae bacterium]|nr:DUF3793 family protein [Erysipelotrichaceae bacterium]MDY5251243.1 DUF3793 family protein [Erysipelotrichaceae bacterium]
MVYCDIKQLDHLMIIHCAPVLKRKKIASMFHINKADFPDLATQIAAYNQKFNDLDIYVTILQDHRPRITIYVYRQQALSYVLKRNNIQHFLSHYGYPRTDLKAKLAYLDKRLALDTYPHEIGIFLGYPLNDVIGFIRHDHCCLNGYWKVYHYNQNIQRLFKIYDTCTKSMLQAINHGKTLLQATYGLVPN